MSELAITIIGGLVVAIVVAIFGLSGTTRIFISNSHRSPRAGKIIILIGVVMIIAGLAWIGNNDSPQQKTSITDGGSLLALYGVLFLIIGKVVKWFQG